MSKFTTEIPYCAIFKDIFPGLSMYWNFIEKKSRTFQEAWEPCKDIVITKFRTHGRTDAQTGQKHNVCGHCVQQMGKN